MNLDKLPAGYPVSRLRDLMSGAEILIDMHGMSNYFACGMVSEWQVNRDFSPFRLPTPRSLACCGSNFVRPSALAISDVASPCTCH